MTIVGTTLSLPFLAVTKVVNFIWWEILFPSPPKERPPKRLYSAHVDEAAYLRGKVRDMTYRHRLEIQHLEDRLRQARDRQRRECRLN
jgi:hypothetical protein